MSKKIDTRRFPDKILLPMGYTLNANRQTREILFSTGSKKSGKYDQRHTDVAFKADEILRTSPYKSYKPIYLDPTLKTGASSTLLEFKAWQDLYLNDPPRGKIAPWTKKEKAYYESLKTKRERYKYLVIRSGLRSAVIDIPYEAYAGVDEDGKLINKDFKGLYELVDENKNTLKTDLFIQEWGIAAGILGDAEYFAANKLHGFNARYVQSLILQMQLTGGSSALDKPNLRGGIYEYAYNVLGFALVGVHENKIRQAQVEQLAKSIRPDKFGMLPYIDEIMGVDWVIDFNQYLTALDEYGRVYNNLSNYVDKGRLKDPRDKDSTPESRKKFDEYTGGFMYKAMLKYYDLVISNDTDEISAHLWLDEFLLVAKIAALTPPQGYPNAPFYYTPEMLEKIYKTNTLDKKLNPTIPAIYKEHFPQALRDEIENYAQRHKIKD